ncbi:sigma-70 family RNA polymerase sigma factor [soil metagenome]
MIESPPAAADPPPLLPRVALGDEIAVKECLRRYGRLVYSLAQRHCPHEADDATQDIFVDLWRSAASYDSEVAREVTFVAMIARRRLIDRARAAKRALTAIDSPMPVRPETIEHWVDARIAARTLATLKTDERHAILLSACHGLSHDEIATELALPLGTVKSHISRGIARVRKALGSKGGPE